MVSGGSSGRACPPSAQWRPSVPTRGGPPVGTSTIDHRSRDGERGRLNRKQAVSLVLRIGLSALMLAILIWRIPPIDLDEVMPRARRPHHRVARAWPWRSRSSALRAVGRAVAAGARGARPARRAAPPRVATAWPASSCRTCCPPPSAATCCGSPACPATRARRPRRSRRSCSSASPAGSCCRSSAWSGFLVNPPLRDLGRATQVALGLAFATLMALCILLYAVADQRIGGRFEAKDGWRRFAGAVHLGLDRLRHEPAATANVLFVGFAYQLVLVLAAVAAAQALGVRPAGLTALLAFFPAVAIAQVLPIGISGPRRARGRLRALPRSARRRRAGRHRPRPAPLPPQPRREPARRARLRHRRARPERRSPAACAEPASPCPR